MRDAPRSVLDSPHALAIETNLRPCPPTRASPFLDRPHLGITWHIGQNARTFLKDDDFRGGLTALRSGSRIPERWTDGGVSAYRRSGPLRLNATRRACGLRFGCLAALDQGEPPALKPLDDSTFLLTAAWPGRCSTTNGHG